MNEEQKYASSVIFICTTNQYSTTILSGYLDVVEELALRSHHHFGLGFQHAREPNLPPQTPDQLCNHQSQRDEGQRKYNCRAQVVHVPVQRFWDPTYQSIHVAFALIALSTMLVSSLSKRIEPRQVILHVVPFLCALSFAMCTASSSILIPTVVADFARHFEVIDEMFEDDEEEDERCENNLDLSLWLRMTVAAAMPSTPNPAS
jgi:hypothetical protein